MLAAIETDINRAFEAFKLLDPAPHHDTDHSLAAGVAAYRAGERVMWVFLPSPQAADALSVGAQLVLRAGVDALMVTHASAFDAADLTGLWPLPPCPGGRHDAVFAQWATRDGDTGLRFVPVALDDDHQGVWGEVMSGPFPADWVDQVFTLCNLRMQSAFRKAQTVDEICRESFGAERVERVGLDKATKAIDIVEGLALQARGASVSMGDTDPFTEWELTEEAP